MVIKYLVSCACFNCYKSFKRHLNEHYFDANQPICPNCGNVTIVMGRKFKTPKKNDAKEWKKIAILLRAGFKVGSHSIANLRNYPSQLNNTAEFIRDNWQKRCPKCIDFAMKHFGGCPRTQIEIERFISQWFKKV